MTHLTADITGYVNKNEYTEFVVDEIINEFDLEEFLSDSGSDFSWEFREDLDPEDKEYPKMYIVKIVAGYLENKIYERTSRDYDMLFQAKTIYDNDLKHKLENAGYTLDDDE